MTSATYDLDHLPTSVGKVWAGPAACRAAEGKHLVLSLDALVEETKGFINSVSPSRKTRAAMTTDETR